MYKASFARLRVGHDERRPPNVIPHLSRHEDEGNALKYILYTLCLHQADESPACTIVEELQVVAAHIEKTEYEHD